MRSALLLSGAATLLLIAAGAARSNTDVQPRKGEVLFENRCARCHGLGGDGADGLAPSLKGVIGSKIGSRPDYFYTPAMKAKEGVWNRETLDHYIADPQGFAPGAEMDIQSPDPEERGAIIDYLASL